MDHLHGPPSERHQPAPPGVVRTLDNVPLGLPLAGVATRGLAFAIDSLLVGLLSVGVVLAAFGVAAATRIRPGWAVAATALALFALQWGYFAIAEIAMGGATPGKAALRLRVVTADGGRPAAGALLLRNLVRGIPDLFVGVFLMAADPLARRVGDRLAGTLVVREAPPRARLTLTRTPAGWGAPEIAVVESYLERAAELEATASWELGERIVRWVARDAPELLEGVEREGRHPATVLGEALGAEAL